MTTSPRSARLLLWAPAAVFSALLWDYVRFYARFPFDDTFIFMRIARRFAETGEPYFNAHERVLGHSSHVWLLAMTLLFKAFGPGLGPVTVMAAVSLIAAFLLMVELLRTRMHPLVALLISATLIVLFVAPASACLMECSLAIALLVATLLALDRGRDGWAGLFAGLAFGTRLEFAALIPLALFVARDRMRFLRGVIGPVAGVLLFTFGYYGTAIPLPVLAKSRVYQDTTTSLLFFALHGAGWKGENGRAFGYLVFTTLALWLLLYWGRIALSRDRTKPGWPFVAATLSIVILLSYIAGGGMVFPWYWPLVTIPLCLSAMALIPNGWRGWLIAGLAVLCFRPLATRGFAAAQGYVERDPTQHFEVKANARTLEYLAIGEKLHAEHPGARLLTTEIGGLGWGFYPDKVIDALALVSPENLKFHPMRAPEERRSGAMGAIPVGAVREAQPEFVVAMESFSDLFRASVETGVLPNYQLMEQRPVVPEEIQTRYSIPGNLWGSQYIAIYARDP